MLKTTNKRRTNRRRPATTATGEGGQCHIVFPLPDICINCGADPLVRGRRSRRPVRGWMRLIFLAKSGSRGTRADQGVRPTIYAGFPVSGKLYDIGLERLLYRAA